MAKHPKKLRRIYMISSAAFSAAACAYGWMAPVGAAFGLMVNLTEDSKQSNIKELNNAVEAALERTRQSILSNTKRKILNELCEMEVEPDNLSQLIKKTEAYRAQYATKIDVKEILSLFEMFFRDEISKSPQLSNLYILSTGVAALEKLKLINDVLVKDEKKLDNIQKEVVKTNRMLTEIKNGLLECLNSISFILIAMVVFLAINIFTGYTYDRMMLVIAPVCYGISGFLVFFLKKSGYIRYIKHIRRSPRTADRRGLMGRIEMVHSDVNRIFSKIIPEFLIPISITVACFWIISLTIGMDREILPVTTFGLECGNIVSIWLKNLTKEETSYEKSSLN